MLVITAVSRRNLNYPCAGVVQNIYSGSELYGTFKMRVGRVEASTGKRRKSYSWLRF